MTDATFHCEKCGAEWTQKPQVIQCRCGSLLVKWINFPEWFASRARSHEYRKVYPL